jgi:hypothetical protein
VTRRAAPALALATALAACSSAPVPGPDEGDWAAVRDGATRRGTLYDRLVHRATATATFLAPQVREARVRRLATWLAWTPDELTRTIAAERAQADAADEFVVAFYTADKHANDLDAPASVWRIAVETGGLEILPTKVTAMDADATVTGLFPWVGTFDTVYRVRFPHPPDGPLAGRKFVLRISSALGALPLDFGAKPKVIDVPRQAP